MTTKPPAPTKVDPLATWDHFDLWDAVRKAISSLPSRFSSELVISGVLATDLFAFNSSLGATIEEQVVDALNKMREVWDPNQKYALYSFERQSQTFPDVVLRASDPSVKPKVLMGIELKGWYVLAKEKEPSFRYKVTPAVCADADLLVVVPWTLDKVISGSPRVFSPYITNARYAAEYRNWHWEHERVVQGSADRGIDLSSVTTTYPQKSDEISDRPKADGGGNFGRFARTNLMKTYIDELFQDLLAGIPLLGWQRFLAIFTESMNFSALDEAMTRFANQLPGHLKASHEAEEIAARLVELVEATSSD